MPKVICQLPHASSPINGIVFEPHPDGLCSVEIADQAVVDNFLSIPGYKAEGLSTAEVEMNELVARAVELGIKVDSRWKAARLKIEIKAVDDEREAEAARQQAADEKLLAGTPPAGASAAPADATTAAADASTSIL